MPRIFGYFFGINGQNNSIPAKCFYGFLKKAGLCNGSTGYRYFVCSCFKRFANCLKRAYSSSDIQGEFRSEEHTSELQSRFDLVCRLLLEKKNCVIYILLIFLFFLHVLSQRLPYPSFHSSSLLPLRPPTPTLFPYTTLFRSFYGFLKKAGLCNGSTGYRYFVCSCFKRFANCLKRAYSSSDIQGEF